MTIFSNRRIEIKPDVLVNEVGGEAVLLDLNSEEYFGLDEVGTRIWCRLTTSPTVHIAYEALLEEYDVESLTLQHDIDELIAKLKDHSLVDVHDP